MIVSRNALERAATFGRRQSIQWTGLVGSLASVIAVIFMAFWGSGESKPVATGAGLPIAVAVTPQLTAPPVEPLLFQAIAPTEAVTRNLAIPIAPGPNPSATPFVLASVDPVLRGRAVGCLTAAVYYEAASERLDGQAAVAQVVLNRLRHPSYPKSVCAVVFQGSERTTGCQFTFACDGGLARIPDKRLWAQARRVAEAALNGNVLPEVGWATHYHTQFVVPYWSPTLRKTAIIGAHIFYRMAQPWGSPRAFTGVYAGVEPEEAGMRSLMDEPTAASVLTPLPDISIPPESTIPSVAATNTPDASPSLASPPAASQPDATPAIPPPPAAGAEPAPTYFPPVKRRRTGRIPI